MQIFLKIFLRMRHSWLISLCLLCLIGTDISRAQNQQNLQSFLPLVMHPPQAAKATAHWSTPLALAPNGTELWVVNPDADSVSVVDTVRLRKLAEIPVGRHPWGLAFAPDGHQLYVLNRQDGSLSVIDPASRQVEATVEVGPEPIGVLVNSAGTQAYVTLSSADRLAVIDTAQLTVTATLTVAPAPYALAMTHTEAGEQLYLTHFFAQPRPDGIEGKDDSRHGLVTVLTTDPLQVEAEIALLPDEHGFPNLLSGIAIANNRAWLPHVRSAPDLPTTLRTTVFAGVSLLELQEIGPESAAYLPLNDEEIFGSPVNNPVAAIPSPDGQFLYVVLAGSDLLEVIDISDPHQPRLVKFLPTGKNPRGLAISPDGRRGYVMNYLSRSLTVIDFTTLAVKQEIDLTQETLSDEVLRGKILFHQATDPRLSRGSWISCASCHPDGGTDTVTWAFPDGPRQTPPLWNSVATLPWHWSAALDEAQDVEDTIHTIQHGLGLSPGADPPLLGEPLAGRSADLDALAAFLVHGIVTPRAFPTSPEAEEGRRLFEQAGCATCHGGPNWTISALPGPAGTLDPDGNGMVDKVLRDVGTVNPLDIRGATGFDVPSLLGVGLTAPYFHDGSMPTLEAVLASGHPVPQQGGNQLSEEDIVLIASFLRTIDANTTPVNVNGRQ